MMQKWLNKPSVMHQHNNTESNLEPDIKNAPGGIRDINQIGWIAKRHFRVNRIYDLAFRLYFRV
jgi:UTP:GlnB (protein PII) uridylyltransferase